MYHDEDAYAQMIPLQQHARTINARLAGTARGQGFLRVYEFKIWVCPRLRWTSSAALCAIVAHCMLMAALACAPQAQQRRIAGQSCGPEVHALPQVAWCV